MLPCLSSLSAPRQESESIHFRFSFRGGAREVEAAGYGLWFVPECCSDPWFRIRLPRFSSEMWSRHWFVAFSVVLRPRKARLIRCILSYLLRRSCSLRVGVYARALSALHQGYGSSHNTQNSIHHSSIANYSRYRGIARSRFLSVARLSFPANYSGSRCIACLSFALLRVSLFYC